MACSLVLSAIIAATSSEPSPSRFVIAGYAPDYRLESLDLTALAHNLTDVLLFSIAPTPQGTIDPGGITQIHHMRAARAKKAAPHLRVLVSMGGGGRSAAFPQAVGSRQRREALARALVKYCKRGKLDGADIDYEAALGPTELRNLVGFLKLLRQAFDAAAPPLQLTMAVHPQHAEALAPAYTHVHHVHLMAYGRVATYDELLRLRVAREAAGEREAGDDRVGEFAYESPRGTARKVELAAALGLAGVMVWEVGQDARPAEARGGLLLGALAEAAAASSVGWEPGREHAARLAAVMGSERTAVGGERDELR